MYLKTIPATAPIKTVSPASYRYLWPDFFKNYPAVVAIINSDKMIKISVLMSVSFSADIFLNYMCSGKIIDPSNNVVLKVIF